MCCPLNLNTSAKLNSDMTLEKTLVVKERTGHQTTQHIIHARTFALFSFSVFFGCVGYLLGVKILGLVSSRYYHFRDFFVLRCCVVSLTGKKCDTI